MPEYVIGIPFDHNRSYTVKAKSLEVAIKVFKTDVLFPERYVARKYIKDSEYIGGAMGYEYTFQKSPKIEIFIIKKMRAGVADKKKKVGEVTLNECVNVDYEDILPKKDIQLLETAHIASDDDERIEELPVVRNVHHVKTLNKQELRNATLEIEKKKREMELMISELNESMAVMKKELHQKLKLLTAFELFLGVHEEVYELKAGELAPEGEPLTVYQQILYMDEEYGACENQGLDKKDLGIFDEWITNNYGKFLYAAKSICVFQVRRQEKKYTDNPLVNMLMNDGNFDTYFLIRNGESLYRMWAGVSIRNRLFPALNEYEEFLKKKDRWDSEEKKREKLKNKHQDYMLGLIYIQGLLERTEVLGSRLKACVNLLTGYFSEKDVVLVRDDEQSKWLGDGQPSWREFTDKNRATVKVGTRIIISRPMDCTIGEDKRTSFNVWGKPSNEQIHIVEGEEEQFYGDKMLRILFNPGDTVWNRETYESHERARRVGFNLYRGEVLNVDAITLDEIEYYLHNRLERKKYLEVMPALYFAKHVKLEEERVEKEFRLLVLGQMGWPLEKEGLVRDAVLWWKLKNKWRRPLAADEAKAVRMIVRKLKRENRIG